MLNKINNLLFSISFLIPDALLVVAVSSIFYSRVPIYATTLLFATYIALAYAGHIYRENASTEEIVEQVNNILNMYREDTLEVLQGALDKIEEIEKREWGFKDEMDTTKSKELL